MEISGMEMGADFSGGLTKARDVHVRNSLPGIAGACQYCCCAGVLALQEASELIIGCGERLEKHLHPDPAGPNRA